MRRGVVCICLSAFGFALMAMFVRLADVAGEPLPAVQKAFFRNVVAFAIAVPAFLRARRAGAVLRPGGMSAGDWLVLTLRSAFGTLGVFTNFYAISVISIGDAMALNKTAPFFTIVACWALMGERMSVRQALCVAGAFLGAMLVVKPGFPQQGHALPSLVGLSSGVFAGVAYALLHRLGRRGVHGSFVVLFFSAFSCAACLPFLAFGCRAMNSAQIASLCAAGAGAALGQFGITWAYRFAEPRQIAVYDYSGLIFAAALGFLAFGQVPDVWSCAGFAVIVAMAICLYNRS
ncbi:MAG: DMT family transporter [Kiritimatiellae bacterium]|nr:DMT family transporter [Kiritimatiellia bacterium]